MPASSDISLADRTSGLVLSVLKAPATLLALPPAERDLAIRLLRRARLSGRIAYDAREHGWLGYAGPVVADHLLGALAFAESRQRAAHWELDRVAWALGPERDYPLVALKGCAYVLAGLPNSPGRMFADVDLMVPEVRLKDVEQALLERRWRGSELSPYDDRYYREWAHELPPLTHSERNVQVDLHHNILMRSARLRLDAALLLRDARQVSGCAYRVLAPVDMVLHAMTHLFYGGEMDDALRELVDVDVLLRHYGSTEDGFWDRFWARAQQLQLGRPAFYGLRYASRLLGTPVPASVIEASNSDAPPAPIVAVMDRLAPRALFPQHPDQSSSRVAAARWLLFVRSHWVRMPPAMLAQHLASKARRRLKGSWGSSRQAGGG